MFPFDPGGELLEENSLSLLDVANQFPFDPGWTSADLTSNVSPTHGARTCQPAPLGDSKGNVSVNSDQVKANDFGKAIDWSRLHRCGAVATPHSLWQRVLQWLLLIGVLIQVAADVLKAVLLTLLELLRWIIESLLGCAVTLGETMLSLLESELLRVVLASTDVVVVPRVRWVSSTLGHAKSGYTHILVAVDHFTKWVEAEAYKGSSTVQDVNLRHFVHRHEVSDCLVADNGSNVISDQLNSVMFQDLGADIRNVTTHHPQANGQVERLTAVICDFLSLNIALRMTNNIGIDFWKQRFLLSILV